MTPEPSVFTKIINRELPADIVFENERIIVIKNIQPQAPIHLLGITKEPFTSIREVLADEKNKDLLWELYATLNQLAEELGIAESGFRINTNVGQDGGQTVMHFHVHLTGGKQLGLHSEE
jgi:histidine triad (HIT) family protein